MTGSGANDRLELGHFLLKVVRGKHISLFFDCLLLNDKDQSLFI